MDLEAFLTGQVAGWLMVFARIGGAMLFLPGFGETWVFMRARLAGALVLSLALYPATPVPPGLPDGLLALLRLLATESLIGLWIGLAARVIFSALSFAGYQAGLVSGLANAFAPSIGAFQGATMIASFLLVAAVALLFVTETHHLIIRALMASYDVFPYGSLMPGDMARQMVAAVQASFYVGLSIAAPFFVMGLILNLGMGLANRMMPTLPVFFVMGSVLIAAGLLILSVAAPFMLSHFLSRFAAWLGAGFTF